MKHHDEALDKLSEAIADFLREQGGHANGNGTYVQGEAKAYVTQHMEWTTPGMDNLSVAQWRRLGSALNKVLSAILESYGIERCRVERHNIGYGCYRTTVEIPYPVRAW